MNGRVLKMELHKVEREIKVSGRLYTFYREETDEYDELTGQIEEVATIRGLFHVSKGYITSKISDATKIHGKGQPLIMMRYEEQMEIQNGDYVMINGNKYKVVEKNNIQEYCIVSDLSLELVLDGNN